MSEHDQTPQDKTTGEQSQRHHCHGRHRGRRWLLAGVAVAVVGALTFACISHARDGGCEYSQHHMGRHHGPINPETAAKHIDGMVSHLLKDGTPEQRAKVSAIAKDALSDLMPLHEQHRAARAKGLQILTQPTIDRAALEQVRADELRLAEQVSKRVTQAIADAAEVLNPEQRLKLAEHLKKRMG